MPIPGLSLRHPYLSKLRRDSVGSDFQLVRKLTNYICAKPPESRLSVFSNTYKHSGDIRIAKIADIQITQHQYFILFPKVNQLYNRT